MTLQAGRVYGSMGRLGVGKQTSAAVPWWLSGGISAANCIAAYQPKGAADLAASYVNLANPGTYNAAPGVAPNFDSAGWVFTGTQWLTTGINPNGTKKLYSIFIRVSNIGDTASPQTLLGSYNNNKNSLLIFFAVNKYQFYSSGLFATTEVVSSAGGVIGISGANGYLNGINVCTIPDGVNLASGVITIASTNGTRILRGGKVQAIAIYNTPLTAPQVAALTAAMAAL